MGSFSNLHQMIPSKKKRRSKTTINRKPPYHSDFMGLHRMTKPVLDAPRHGAEAPPEETQDLSVPSRAPAANPLGLELRMLRILSWWPGFNHGNWSQPFLTYIYIYTIYMYILYLYNIYIYIYIYTIYIYYIYIVYR
jgi:hypothetical protein